MRIYYAAQLIERGQNLPLKLVSLGLVREDGKELYVVNEENLSEVMLNNRLALNAVQHLPIKVDPSPTLSMIYSWNTEHPEYQHVLPLGRLTSEVLAFITEDGPAELWSHYGAYSHVVLCQLFGALGELPAGVPMYTHELQQLIDDCPTVPLPVVPEGTHHAMTDARWVRDAYLALVQGSAFDGPLDIALVSPTTVESAEEDDVKEE